MIKVLIVDDSLFMRRGLADLLSGDSGVTVAGQARDGLEALKLVREVDPDVITMDVEMPRMDGLATVRKIMETAPCPIIMISSLTESGAEVTLKALEAGAVDFMPKSMGVTADAFGVELLKKIHAVARKKALMRLRFSAKRPPAAGERAVPAFSSGHGVRDLVAIGVSTGGPPVVQKILSRLPADLPACILIAQHMPSTFTGPFARRLDSQSPLTVTEAAHGDRLMNGHVYVCPGGKHIGIVKKNALLEVSVTEEPQEALYKPTVNVLLETAGRLCGRRALGVMLTGMGSDGCDGAKVFKEKGGYLIAQDEASCVVYGMPKAVVDAGLADLVLDCDQIADAIVACVRGK